MCIRDSQMCTRIATCLSPFWTLASAVDRVLQVPEAQAGCRLCTIVLVTKGELSGDAESR
eukprot:8310164-Prorocentrum_lima.AAC.1